MIKFIKITYPILGFVLFSMLVTGCATQPMAAPPTVTSSDTYTLPLSSPTDTEIPPTRTATSSPTPTLTATTPDTPTPTPTPEPTATPEPVLLTFNQDSVCMVGASFDHNVDHYVNSGTTYGVIGQVNDRSWWLVEVGEEKSCWAYAGVSGVTGNVDLIPVVTPPSLPTLTPTPQPVTQGIYYILIDEDTGGPFGCGDSLIRWYPGVWVKGGMEEDIKGALNALFANHNQYTNGLFNPIYQSDLKAKSVEVVHDDVVVYLAGKLVKPKDSCESKRMHAQIWYTVSQFSPTRAVIYLNNALLGDLLVVSNK